ncbi:17.4 kDa class III heat shock protein [Elaeis guineensis]|uniref:17.4 kDa class III heat shock protein n=1 Tax=Elaeis guineensis var. tenera TaxID=51953 RepID=A0A6I9QYH5_ELAGV|nr:17.4 kDa class III heat shock protein [Elaeis guineensis]
MSPVADSVVFDTAVSHLLHLPETLEKLVFPSPRPQDGHGGAQGRPAGEERGFGGVPVDILETPKEYTFFFDVPGLSKTDIQVTLEEDEILVIKSNGKRKREEGEEEGCKYLRLERRASSKFLRKFRVPEDAKTAAITAKCENGVLTVVVEKLPPPEPKTKTVEVAVA